MTLKTRPPQEYLDYAVNVLRYHPTTGEFTYRIAPPNQRKIKPGEYAGYIDAITGYLRIKITINKKSVRIQGHNLAWYIHYGVWPDFLLDHENLIRHDNSIKNIRKATHSGNMANMEAKITNKLGIKGVRQEKSGKFRARIDYGNQYEFSRLYDTVEEASDWYRIKAKKIFGRFSRSTKI